MMTDVATELRGSKLALGQKTNFKATILYDGMHIADCLIKAVSGTGMKLFIDRTAWLPQDFTVKINNDNILAVRRVSSSNDIVDVCFKYASEINLN